MTTIAEGLPTMKNPTTGNTFMVIAQGEATMAGIRFWLNQNGHTTSFSYRFRITAAPGVSVDDFREVATALFPDTYWNGGSTIHVSVVEDVGIAVSPWMLPKIMELVQQNDVGAVLFDMLQERFRALNFTMTRASFQQMFEEEVERMLDSFVGTEELGMVKHEVVAVTLCGVTKKVEGGK